MEQGTMRSERRWTGRLAGGAGIAWAAAPARCSGKASAEAAVADQAAAEALFDEARRLVSEGKQAEAWPKFAESHRLDPGVGILLYLGDCYEAIGKTASAWAAFREAEAGARAARHAEREAAARERAAALEARLASLGVAVPEPRRVAVDEVSRDGEL